MTFAMLCMLVRKHSKDSGSQSSQANSQEQNLSVPTKHRNKEWGSLESFKEAFVKPKPNFHILIPSLRHIVGEL
jgi:hypothetical protein